ncbi:NAD(P)/FAD-dependent oxidoreductase [Plantactinospora solaniradicis]|uniref:NAD(P)/FAD-dependent oxidoreductase n=1 Tax=Plantactinospora solaniradicis TaxID=1723736 RepID=A0ABW1KA34_9ACTN
MQSRVSGCGWGGTLDLTPDHLPLLGTPSGVDGYVVAAGFSGHGFCLGPAIGRTVAEIVTGQPTSVDVTALHPDRFAAC